MSKPPLTGQILFAVENFIEFPLAELAEQSGVSLAKLKSLEYGQTIDPASEAAIYRVLNENNIQVTYDEKLQKLSVKSLAADHPHQFEKDAGGGVGAEFLTENAYIPRTDLHVFKYENIEPYEIDKRQELILSQKDFPAGFPSLKKWNQTAWGNFGSNEIERLEIRQIKGFHDGSVMQPREKIAVTVRAYFSSGGGRPFDEMVLEFQPEGQIFNWDLTYALRYFEEKIGKADFAKILEDPTPSKVKPWLWKPVKAKVPNPHEQAILRLLIQAWHTKTWMLSSESKKPAAIDGLICTMFSAGWAWGELRARKAYGGIAKSARQRVHAGGKSTGGKTAENATWHESFLSWLQPLHDEEIDRQKQDAVKRAATEHLNSAEKHLSRVGISRGRLADLAKDNWPADGFSSKSGGYSQKVAPAQRGLARIIAKLEAGIDTGIEPNIEKKKLIRISPPTGRR